MRSDKPKDTTNGHRQQFRESRRRVGAGKRESRGESRGDIYNTFNDKDKEIKYRIVL